MQEYAAAYACAERHAPCSTNNPDLTPASGGMSDGQHALHAPRLLDALALIEDLDPVIADVLRNLHLRAYATETTDRIIAFEVNGSGEHDHPIR
ncbi:hypothetical protein EV385_0525 [Krasilnikovia cinnamomea]|uniref:Uncharacterized protein n=1 Tax=Krasilnikovia cinnamomea TaxID=349313 RepID=A0A4Q7ZEV7_9ACTN|nr:hypothetical protein [Krasilnikovia cinnamomea]RZU48801.1 hypothetical protein EV385_0525 [Krasilnikovia cinnamomea]